MTTIQEIENCCGCRTCEQICPQKCISFIIDEEGFFVPQIDETRCTECGLCYHKCNQKGYELFHKVKKTYAALHKDYSVVINSSSGGGMTSIAEQIIRNNGVVYGTYLDPKDWKAKFKSIDNINELDELRGSKYVQSDTGNVYHEIKTILDKGRDVLFAGVPCQVAGLYMYLGGNEFNHLYTIDLLCHGTPSPELFTKHIEYLENKYKRKITGFSFRDKSKFPNKVALKYTFDKKETCVLAKCELYFNAFISGSSNRMCCYDCQYARKDRVGDITLGDYWGIRKVHPKLDDSFGMSLILANTSKGIDLVKTANLQLVDSDLDKAAIWNGVLNKPDKKAVCREWFYKDVRDLGYEKALKKNIRTYPMIYNFFLTHLPRKIIKILSRIK